MLPNGWGLKFTSQWEGVEEWTEPSTDRELDVTQQLHPGSWWGSAQTRVISTLGKDGRALPRGQRCSEIREKDPERQHHTNLPEGIRAPCGVPRETEPIGCLSHAFISVCLYLHLHLDRDLL